jgi:excisionase family DNA binding protein
MPDLSVAEFAALKGVTTRTVRKWIAAGYVKAERVGPKLIRIPASELERVGNPISAA